MRAILFAAGLSLAAPPSRWSEPEPAGCHLLWLDPDMSPQSGAENLLFLGATLGRLEDRVLPVRLFADENLPLQAVSATYRLAKLAFLDLMPAAYLPLIQHEIFGHGYRAREAGYMDIGYELGAPPPYGLGDGSTSWSYPAAFIPAPDQDLSMAMAGIEATDILGQRLRARFLQEGSLDYHAAFLYLFSSLGLANYLAVTDADETDVSNDMVAYVAALNGKPGNGPPGEDRIRLADLEEGSRLAFADPFLYYSGWAVMRYLIFGETRTGYRAFSLGPVRYLPSLGFRLSPFGGQVLVENLAVWDRRSFNLRLAFGEGRLGDSRGADLEARDFLAWNGFSLDATLRLWKQPPLRLDYDDPRPATASGMGFGSHLAVTSPALSPSLPMRLALGVAHKTSGYVPGERLDQGFTFRIGFGLFH